MNDVGVIHGRFQILHNDHMKYLLAGKERCRYLLIGIANPDEQMTKYNAAAPHRSEKQANPLTYYERFEMITGSMLEAGIRRDEFDIVPFPINCPERLFNYVPSEAYFYLTIYDAWGLEKKRILEELGCNVDIMWQKPLCEKGLAATEVRRLMCEGLPWEHLVPPFVANYIKKHSIIERIRILNGCCPE